MNLWLSVAKQNTQGTCSRDQFLGSKIIRNATLVNLLERKLWLRVSAAYMLKLALSFFHCRARSCSSVVVSGRSAGSHILFSTEPCLVLRLHAMAHDL